MACTHPGLNFLKFVDFSFFVPNWEISTGSICVAKQKPVVQRKLFYDHYTLRTRASKMKYFQCLWEKHEKTKKEKVKIH